MDGRASLLVVIFARVVLGAEIDCSKPADNINPDFCCRTPLFFNDDLIFQCERSVGFNDSAYYSDLPDDYCVSECLMNRTKININGKIDKDMLQLKLTEKIRSGWWLQMLPEFIDVCFESQNQEAPKNGTKSRCRPNSLNIMDCIYFKLFGNCPEEIWKDTERCRNLRNYVIQCSNQNS